MNRVLIDTNIFVYSLDKDSIYYNRSRKIINDKSLNLFTTSKNISEFLSVITRQPDKYLSIKEALEIIMNIQNFVTILYPDTNSYKYFLELLQKYKPTGLVIHDFEIASIGIANKMDFLATINNKDFSAIEEIELYKV
jgi:predicted nucleic acid-binding protein